MTATPILEALSREFTTSVETVHNALEMLDAGLSAPFIGRIRRAQVSGLPESVVRRLDLRRRELEELDRRRGTILRLIERQEDIEPGVLDAIRGCMDRFELEDLFIPHRRPEPEVQLALDRGLGALADELVKPISREEREGAEPREERSGAAETEATPPAQAPSGEAAASDALTPSPENTPGATADERELPGQASEQAAGEQAAGEQSAGEHGTGAPTLSEHTASVATSVAESPASTDSPASTESPSSTESPAAPEAQVAGAERSGSESAESAATTGAAPAGGKAPAAEDHGHIDVRAAMNAQLARVCAPYVHPDRGVHTEAEALSGALRILSDRLGRDARLRGVVRRALFKHGVLTVRATGPESKLGRHRSLLKMKDPLRQVQGHRLLAIRQAQKERVLNTHITLAPDKVLPKVRAALGKHTHPAHEEVLHEVARQALEQRLLPMVEQDVRLELKERADAEALRFLAQHLRQVLLTPPFGHRPVTGIDVNAKGDWILAALDGDGNPVAPELKIETGGTGAEAKDAATLGAELATFLDAHPVHALAVGHGKGPRAAVPRIRSALAAVGRGEPLFVVNEAGLSSYASSELARRELPESSVSMRMAISLGRRLQEPLWEILKADPRHLGLGSEQGLVSKANVRRVLEETIESCAALVGCDVNRAPEVFLRHLPGLDRDAVKRLVERRAERAFESREALREEGVLTPAQWTSCVSFLRVTGSPQRLDATSLHPEQYPLVQRLLESVGSSVDEGVGRMGATRGLRRVDFDVDEATWRDLMREIGHPGRDPRPRLPVPELLAPETDSATLAKDQVVQGIVTNVASFGAFVDVGLPADAMIHISEISERYVRDARELLSIGQVVRARVVDPSGQRMSLSLKRVPPAERPARGGGRGRRGEGHGEGRGERRGPRGDREPKTNPNLRAAQTRRDGLAGAGGGRRGGFGGGFGGGKRPGGRRPRDEEGSVDRAELERLRSSGQKAGTHNPFANFFKEKGDDEGAQE